MDQKDSANNQSIVKTIMIGSRILAQGIYKGEAAKGAIQIKIRSPESLIKARTLPHCSRFIEGKKNGA